MNSFLVTIALKLGEYLWPKLKELLKEQLAEHLPELKAAIIDELKNWLPVIARTVVTGIAQSAGQLVVNTTDKVTDIIPGQVDDAIIDPIVRDVLGKVSDWTGLHF